MADDYQSQTIRSEGVGIGTCISLVVAAFVIYSCMEVSGALDRVYHALNSHSVQSNYLTEPQQQTHESQESKLPNLVND